MYVQTELKTKKKFMYIIEIKISSLSPECEWTEKLKCYPFVGIEENLNEREFFAKLSPRKLKHFAGTRN